MKKWKFISILCTAALLFSAVMPASAAQAVLKVTKDASDNQENVGTIKFDPGDWNSEKIQFIIVDESAEPDTKFATKNGWVDEFPEDGSVFEGTKLPDGTFESFEFEIPDGHAVYLELYDPDNEAHDTFDVNLTKEAFGKTVVLTGEKIVRNPNNNFIMPEAEVKDTDLKSRLYFNWYGELIGKQVHPYADGAGEVAILVYGFSNHLDEKGKSVVTPEKVSAAIEAFGTNAEDVLEIYKKMEGYDDRYSEEFARSVLFPEEQKDGYTYYFLAPDDWFKTDKGAVNEDIGCFWWDPEETDPWPGVKMEKSPDIGENVFKITGVSPEITTVIFNAFIDTDVYPYPELTAYQTVTINTEGYEKRDCEYDSELVTDNFDGWIFVLNRDDERRLSRNELSNLSYYGAWFTLDDYKNHSDYYGTYFSHGCLGDLDGDENITSGDALEILRMSVGLSEETPEKAKLADVDGDGEITSADALIVLRYSIGAGENFGKLGTPIYR